MKIITVKFKTTPDKRNEIIILCQGMLTPSRAEEGCLSYNFYQDTIDVNTFFFYEEWQDQLAIDIHFATSHFVVFQPIFNSLIIDEAELKIHNVN